MADDYTLISDIDFELLEEVERSMQLAIETWAMVDTAPHLRPLLDTFVTIRLELGRHLTDDATKDAEVETLVEGAFNETDST